MPKPSPVYTVDNCRVAYQLNWSVNAFPRTALPNANEWLPELKVVTELDGVRILECRICSTNTIQTLVSSRPEVSPADIVRSVKGRLQHLLRNQIPRAFHRNYRIESVGSANTKTLDRYIGKQSNRHRMVDPAVQQRFEKLQYQDRAVDLGQIQTSSSGQFIHNLHLVLENCEGWHECREEILLRSRDMIIQSSRAKRYRLARIGLVSDHIHLLLGCDVTDDPQAVALAFMNNLAYVQAMRPVFKFSFYIGTFGRYDRQAIRRNLP